MRTVQLFREKEISGMLYSYLLRQFKRKLCPEIAFKKRQKNNIICGSFENKLPLRDTLLSENGCAIL